jgi:NADPH:quinone reductase-like Zn-dependent oxidoreductase
MKETIPQSMNALRLHAPGGVSGLVYERIDTPRSQPGDVLVRVHAAAITRDELEWPVDRLPAIPSYECSGVVVATASDVNDVALGEEVYALTAFDRRSGCRLHDRSERGCRSQASNAQPYPERHDSARSTHRVAGAL